MVEIDTEKLIQAVKRRPALYDKMDPLYYNHKKQKCKVWVETCRDVCENWDQLRPQDRVEYCHDLQRRWKSLRTCFSRELQFQKKEKVKQEVDGKPTIVKRRKRYEYFDMMSFLLEPSAAGEHEDMEVRESDDDTYDPLDTMKDEDYAQTAFEEAANTSLSPHVVIETDEHSPFQKHINRSEHAEENGLKLLKEIKKYEEDDDRQFMLSLLPSFRKLKNNQKFEVKIEMLKMLKKFQEPE